MGAIKGKGIRGMDYRQLSFFQKARQVISGLNLEIKQWPKTMQAQGIARQVFRSATSTGANIAEGHGRHIGKEYIHFLFIAQGSANEVDHWLNTCLDCEVGNNENISRLLALNTETRKMLSATISTLREKRNPNIRESPSPYTLTPFSAKDNDELPPQP